MAPPPTPFIDPAIASALSTLCAILSMKIVITHVLTARARVMSKTFDKWGNGGKDMAITTGMFKLMLGAFGPKFGGTDFVDAAHNYCKNCAENEPFFVMSAFFAAASGGKSALLLSCINVFQWSRVAHWVFYAVGPLFPTGLNMMPRSTAWMGGVLAHVCVAYSVLSP
jgi:uncharacterized MAPEG superfamily protein